MSITIPGFKTSQQRLVDFRLHEKIVYSLLQAYPRSLLHQVAKGSIFLVTQVIRFSIMFTFNGLFMNHKLNISDSCCFSLSCPPFL
ncbi:unnamed protein product [Coffea canephora]|uniref:Uncharacterized protein n=1 Tax=Coffea canephora TaxID=49390 RepID=A0A068TY09_COFCA|nr:unnamed protein product [Coffea canephora]